MTSVVTLKPRNGKLVKESSWFRTMNPFLEITVGTETHQTETAHNQGKAPNWTSVMRFTFSSQKKPQDIIVKIEAFDQNGSKKESIGLAIKKLSELKPNEKTLVELKDTKNNLAGTVEVECELSGDAMATSTFGGANKPAYLQSNIGKYITGTIVLKPLKGKFDLGADNSDEFFLIITHGDVVYQSMSSEGPGRTPIFKDIISFQRFEGQDMTFKCYYNDLDRNDHIGEGFIPISVLVNKGNHHHTSFPLSLNGRNVGEISFEIEFLPEIFNNLLKVYPTVPVRKNQFVDKKIKYYNPDKFIKVLNIRSDNKNLVFPKEEMLVINPGEYGEIRFTISAPTKVNEERCQVDIVLDDTRAVEESLLFKVQMIAN